MSLLLVSTTLFLPFPADQGYGDTRSTLAHRTVIQTALSGFVVLSAVVVPRSLVVVMIVVVVVVVWHLHLHLHLRSAISLYPYILLLRSEAARVLFEMEICIFWFL